VNIEKIVLSVIFILVKIYTNINLIYEGVVKQTVNFCKL